MNEHSSFVNRSLNTLTRGLLAASTGALLATSAQGQLAQRPLLVNATGAKPNLMITLDNSGSMASPIPDDYHITVSDNRGGFWRAMRSPEVNPLYYNPRITYLPRVDASGQPLPVKGDTVFVSNQTQAQYSYGLWGTTLAGFKTTPPVVVRPDESPRPTAPRRAWWCSMPRRAP